MTRTGSPVPAEALAALRHKLALLPPRHPERAVLMQSTYTLYGISRPSLYRLLHGESRPRDIHRVDRGRPRVMPAVDVEMWCEIVAAMQARTQLGGTNGARSSAEAKWQCPVGREPA